MSKLNKIQDNNIVCQNNEIMKIEQKEKIAPITPDGGFGWVVVCASFITNCLGDGIVFSFGIFTTEFIEHLEVSRSVVGFIESLLVAMSFAVGPLASIMCDKWGYRVVTILGSIMGVIGFASPIIIYNSWLFIILTSFGTGVGLGLIYFSSLVIIGVYFDKMKGIAYGIALSGSGIGTFLLSPLLEVLIEEYSWKGAMLISSGFILNCIPCGLLFRSLKCNHEIIKLRENVSEKDDEKPKLYSILYEILCNPLFILFTLSSFIGSIAFFVPYIYMTDRAMSVGISYYKSSFLISSIGIGNTFGKLLYGLGATVERVNIFHLYSMTLIVNGILHISSWGARNYVWMIIYTFLFGTMSGGLTTVKMVLLTNLIGKEKLNISFGILNAVTSMTLIIGPPIFGFIYDITNSFDVSFLACGICTSTAGSIMYFACFSKYFRKEVFNTKKN